MKKKSIFKWLKILTTAYLLVGMGLYFLQDYMLFHPVSLKREKLYDFPQPHKDISIPLNDKDTLNLVDFQSTAGFNKGLVLYFHGNKKNISWYSKYIPYFTRHGYQVLMIDYPGFGKSTGKLTEEKIYEWAEHAYQIALKRFPADSIVIYGKSMGTGIAAYLASVRDCQRLILETPYYDFPSVVSNYLPIYPVKWMLHYQFPTHLYLENVQSPISMIHGTSDWIVSYDNSLQLKKKLKPGDELITIPKGNHNNLFQFDITTRKIDSLLGR